MQLLKSDDLPTYEVEHLQPTPEDAEPGSCIVASAIRLVESMLQEPGELMSSPEAARDLVFLELAREPAEVFAVLFLDNRHRLIEFRRLFAGTIDGANVHPREVVRACIDLNAAALILTHNHPSGDPEPSHADITLTKRLVEAMALVDVRILDHIICGRKRDEIVSFAERGLI